MSLPAIKQIIELEESLRQQKEAAQASAKKSVAEAEQAGQMLMERLREQAEAEVATYIRDAEEKAALEGAAIREEAEASCASLRENAKLRLNEAVALVVGRIVKAR